MPLHKQVQRLAHMSRMGKTCFLIFLCLHYIIAYQAKRLELLMRIEFSCDYISNQFSGPYLGFFVCGGKLGFREISDQYSYKKQPSKIRHYVRKKTFSFPGGGNCPLRPPAMYGPGSTWSIYYLRNFLYFLQATRGDRNPNFQVFIMHVLHGCSLSIRLDFP